MSELGRTQLALGRLRGELGKTVDDGAAERIAAAVEVLIEAKLTNFADLVDERVNYVRGATEKPSAVNSLVRALTGFSKL